MFKRARARKFVADLEPWSFHHHQQLDHSIREEHGVSKPVLLKSFPISHIHANNEANTETTFTSLNILIADGGKSETSVSLQ